MTFFEQELKKLFADDTAFMDKRFIAMEDWTIIYG